MERKRAPATAYSLHGPTQPPACGWAAAAGPVAAQIGSARFSCRLYESPGSALSCTIKRSHTLAESHKQFDDNRPTQTHSKPKVSLTRALSLCCRCHLGFATLHHADLYEQPSALKMSLPHNLLLPEAYNPHKVLQRSAIAAQRGVGIDARLSVCLLVSQFAHKKS